MSESDDTRTGAARALEEGRDDRFPLESEPAAVRDPETSLSARIDRFMIDSTPPERPTRSDDSTEMYFHGALPDPDELSGLDMFFEREPSHDGPEITPNAPDGHGCDPAATRPVGNANAANDLAAVRPVAPTDSKLPDDAAIAEARRAVLRNRPIETAQAPPTRDAFVDETIQTGSAVSVTATHQVLPPRTQRDTERAPAETGEHQQRPDEPNAQTALTGDVTSTAGMADRDDTVPPDLSPEELVAAIESNAPEKDRQPKFEHARILRRPRARDTQKDS